MKLDQIEQVEEKELERRIRYRVTLTTSAGNATVFWQMNVNGSSPRDAVMTAQQLFRKGRGDILSRRFRASDNPFLSRPSQTGTV